MNMTSFKKITKPMDMQPDTSRPIVFGTCSASPKKA